ncbi:hypothetical protein M1307_00920 [Patescibacteria group bacterium]|nr:hypothetical protein [Patescibacteria group bacterium]
MIQYNKMDTSPKSRLKRKIEKQAKKQSILFTLGILFVLFIIVKFGLGVITGIGGFFVKVNEIKGTAKTQTSQTQEVLIPPTLDTIPQATKEPNVKITGKTNETNGSIQLFLNDSLDTNTKVNKDGTFTFDKVSLKEGENTIKVRLRTDNDKTSDFSDEYTISYIKSGPKLDVNSPSDGATFSKDNQEITVQGKTDPNNKVTVNGFWAIIDQDGNYSYTLKLNNGDNTISIEATDPAGNSTKKEVKVTYNP